MTFNLNNLDYDLDNVDEFSEKDISEESLKIENKLDHL